MIHAAHVADTRRQTSTTNRPLTNRSLTSLGVLALPRCSQVWFDVNHQHRKDADPAKAAAASIGIFGTVSSIPLPCIWRSMWQVRAMVVT